MKHLSSGFIVAIIGFTSAIIANYNLESETVYMFLGMTLGGVFSAILQGMEEINDDDYFSY